MLGLAPFVGVFGLFSGKFAQQLEMLVHVPLILLLRNVKHARFG